MEKELLPIGTVVTLINHPKTKLMIIGYKPVKEDETVKDYVAVAYPIGCIDNKTFLAFDKSEIGEIVFEGYSDSLFEIYKNYYHNTNNNTNNL